MSDVSLKQKYYEDIIAVLPGHVYWKDINGKFLGCNLAQARDAGFKSPEEMIGKTDFDMPWSHQATYLREIDRKVMESGTLLSLEELFELPDGTKRIYLSKKLPLFDEDDKVSGVLGISFDITDRKQLELDLKKSKELAEAATEAKAEFLENMRHDLRTPLTGILGFAEIIKQEANNKRVAEYADNLVAASNTLLEFLNEILEGIKVLAGEIPIVKRKFNLPEMTTKIIDLFRPKAIQKNLTLNVYCSEDLPKLINGDPKRIQRIIIELLSNAINFTNDGEVTLNVTVAKKNGRDHIIKLQVTDTGIGIPRDKQEDIFVRFKRLIPSYKGIYKGSGLGLAIVKQFIDELKGEIYCASEMGKGSTFTCLLELEESLSESEGEAIDLDSIFDSDSALTKTVSSTASLNKEKGQQTKVLLVEDQSIAAKVAASIISNLDCDVDIAENAESALTFIQKTEYEIIFMDIGLPDLSGIELTKQIRTKEWRQEKHVPIVALTAHIDTENKEDCISAGMDAVLSKPLKSNTASDIINAFIPRRRTVSERIKEDDLNSLSNLSGEIIDYQEGIDKMGGNETAASELLKLLKQSLQEELPLLNEAREANNWEKIQAIAHKLRGGSSYCGTQRLQQACAILEDYLADKKTKWQEEIFQQLITEIGAVVYKLD